MFHKAGYISSVRWVNLNWKSLLSNKSLRGVFLLDNYDFLLKLTQITRYSKQKTLWINHEVAPAPQKQPPSRDFHTLYYVEFTENNATNQTHPVSSRSLVKASC